VSGKIVKFIPKDAAQNPDFVLEQSIGNYESVVIIGWDKQENLHVRASNNLSNPDVLWLISLFSHKLLNGDYCE